MSAAKAGALHRCYRCDKMLTNAMLVSLVSGFKRTQYHCVCGAITCAVEEAGNAVTKGSDDDGE